MIDKILLAKSDMIDKGDKPLYLHIDPRLRWELTTRDTYLSNPSGFDSIFGLNIISNKYIKKWKISENRVFYKFPPEKDDKMEKKNICPVCNGAGVIEQEKHKFSNYWSSLRKERTKLCVRCNGSGEI
jgi:hypothetical protein